MSEESFRDFDEQEEKLAEEFEEASSGFSLLL